MSQVLSGTILSPMADRRSDRAMRLLLFGPPASGKGTQSDRLSERLGIPQVATGNILRAQVALRTELGARAAAVMERGDLVPDELMIEIIRVRLLLPDCRGGFLLDGFPRTLGQARALDSLAQAMAISFDRVIYLRVSDEELVRRISGRLTCAICSRSYFFEPGRPHPEACEEDGGMLLVREDDRPETARRRISVYVENTFPILDHYRGQGLVTEIDGLASADEVTDRILSSLESTQSVRESSPSLGDSPSHRGEVAPPVMPLVEGRRAAESRAILVRWMGVMDANLSGFVHGGTVMHLCDEVAALAAIRHSRQRVVTAAVDRTAFLHTIQVGELLTLTASVNAAWRSSMEIGVLVEAENAYTGQRRHTNSAYLTMVAVDDDGRPVSVPPLITETSEEQRREREAQLRRRNRLAERDQIMAERDSSRIGAPEIPDARR